MIFGIRKHTGITLVELIISTAVVGIVMMGVVSSDYAMRKQADLSFKASQASLDSQAMLTHIMTSAFNATGLGSDPGVYVGPQGGLGQQTFCIRTAHTPKDVADNWVCYSNVSAKLYTCSGSAIQNCTNLNTYLGVLYSDSNTVTNVALPTPAGKNSSLTLDFVPSDGVGVQQIVITASVSVPDTSNSTTGKATAVNSICPLQYNY